MHLAALAVLILSAVPAALFLLNLPLFRRPRVAPHLPIPRISVLIPARNESANIETVLRSALASEQVELEVLILDDHSEDDTAARVTAIAERHPEVRLLSSKPLPADWAGKMFACHQLAAAATSDWLLFLDADVSLTPDAIRAVVDHARTSPLQPALVSGPPEQITITWLEKLLIPLIHFVLLGYLPFLGMRLTKNAAFAAGVGQFFLIRRHAYEQSGGHAAIRSTFHDGVAMARLLRRSGYPTDLTDLTGRVRCRMYHDAAGVWNGLLKNAAEGLGAPGVIGPMTLLLIGGQVLPWILLPFAAPETRPLLLAACGLGLFTRLVATIRFRQSWGGFLLHPFGVLVLELIQWTGFFRHLRGIRPTWKGREAIQ